MILYPTFLVLMLYLLDGIWYRANVGRGAAKRQQIVSVASFSLVFRDFVAELCAHRLTMSVSASASCLNLGALLAGRDYPR